MTRFSDKEQTNEKDPDVLVYHLPKADEGLTSIINGPLRNFDSTNFINVSFGTTFRTFGKNEKSGQETFVHSKSYLVIDGIYLQKNKLIVMIISENLVTT